MPCGSIRAIGPIGVRTLSLGRVVRALVEAAAAGSAVGGCSFFVHPETLPRKSAVSATDTKVRELIPCLLRDRPPDRPSRAPERGAPGAGPASCPTPRYLQSLATGAAGALSPAGARRVARRFRASAGTCGRLTGFYALLRHGRDIPAGCIEAPPSRHHHPSLPRRSRRHDASPPGRTRRALGQAPRRRGDALRRLPVRRSPRSRPARRVDRRRRPRRGLAPAALSAGRALPLPVLRKAPRRPRSGGASGLSLRG